MSVLVIRRGKGEGLANHAFGKPRLTPFSGVAEISYTFTPLLGLTTSFSPGTFEMTRTFYTRPRRSMKVAKTDNGC